MAVEMISSPQKNVAGCEDWTRDRPHLADVHPTELPRPASSGVLQGSVLGPILFLLYINDLPDTCNVQSQDRLFADDTAVNLTINHPEDSAILQADLDKLQDWEAQWDMEFNPGKCQVLQELPSKHHIASELPKNVSGIVAMLHLVTRYKVK